ERSVQPVHVLLRSLGQEKAFELGAVGDADPCLGHVGQQLPIGAILEIFGDFHAVAGMVEKFTRRPHGALPKSRAADGLWPAAATPRLGSGSRPPRENCK